MRTIKFRAELPDEEQPNWMRQYYVRTLKPSHKCQGYIRRKVENHPFADKRGYVPEHRLVMEKHLGRFLEPTEFVHHRDQIRDNNRISNLELQGSQSKHNKKHHKGERNPHGQFVADEPIFSELKYRFYNKNTKTTRIYSLATLIGTTFRRGQFEFRGRFTGLKDKNGIEIYEGDLLTDGKSDLIRQAEWLDVETRWCGYDKYLEFCEVIGNIYENPELLT